MFQIHCTLSHTMAILFVPISVHFCPLMPQKLLSLPLSFHVLIIATLYFLAVLSTSETIYRRFRTTLLALYREFLKLTTFLLIFILFIGCPLIQRYSTNSILFAITASTRLLLNLTTPDYLTELPRIYKPTCQLSSSSDTSILCLRSVHTHSLGQRYFPCATPSVWNTLLRESGHPTPSSFISSIKNYLFQQSN